MNVIGKGLIAAAVGAALAYPLYATAATNYKSLHPAFCLPRNPLPPPGFQSPSNWLYYFGWEFTSTQDIACPLFRDSLQGTPGTVRIGVEDGSGVEAQCTILALSHDATSWGAVTRYSNRTEEIVFTASDNAGLVANHGTWVVFCTFDSVDNLMDIIYTENEAGST